MSKDTRPGFFEHDVEPVPGLPAELPQGESILWQGKPRFGGLARRALHLRWMSVYFMLLALWRGVALALDGGDALEVAQGAAFILLLGAVPMGLLALYGWASARMTLYTITTRRVVIRTGVALPMNVNIPFAVIGSAALAQHEDGTGDIALQVMKPHRVSWMALWPCTRSWHMSHPQPTLRGVAQPEKVAQALGRALAAASSMPVRAVAQAAPGTQPTPDRVKQPAAAAAA
ncbi:photosynthetic complex putative assembly protein PuhB [Falsiroseomonas oryziterrae]|uniref:photosynthetic complex putative assembly protein PuhB n=1 Tax=Falsiroseomonas oryziterrae TaxID=2911368 RepID=UPI001F431F2A|nr:photosynthetic complex putative assembly protein PuhB [Roseomonas sp. NPKOSM-4]